MKHLTIMAAAALFTPAAYAQSTSQIAYNLEAEVSVVCGVYSTSPAIDIDFGDLATVDQSQFIESSASGRTAGYRCNSPGGFTRTIASANNGFLVRTGSAGGANNRIPFEIKHGGGSGLGFAYLQLTTPKTDTLTGNFVGGATGSVQFKVPGVLAPSTNNNGAPGTTVLAGDYTDVVTITVTAQ